MPCIGHLEQMSDSCEAGARLSEHALFACEFRSGFAMNRKSGAKSKPEMRGMSCPNRRNGNDKGETYEIEPIAHIRTPFPKFGIPRQKRTGHRAKGTIVFEPKYRDPDALRGIEGFSHLWLIWGFSDVEAGEFSPLVRRRVWVATRSAASSRHVLPSDQTSSDCLSSSSRMS